jgi:hypothetical protein
MAAELRFRQKEIVIQRLPSASEEFIGQAHLITCERFSLQSAARSVLGLIGHHFVDAAWFDCRSICSGQNVARKGTRMKIAFAVLTLCTFAQGALAMGPDCRAIESTSGRLACYDAAHPPKMEKPAAVENDVSRAAYKDPFIAEDARTTAKLKNICRGC